MPFIAPAIAAFAASGLLESVALNVAIGVGASLLSSVLSPHNSAAASQPTGVDLQQQIGANTPIQFPMGWSATAGLLAYPGTWGNDGDTPNAYAVFESILSFLPVTGHPVPWIGTQKCTVDWAATPTAQGYPLLEFRDEATGKDYAWLQYDDGTQTTASSYMVGKFGSHPTRPYTSAMVGTGLAKVRLTLLLNQNLWSSTPNVLFETNGINLYNPAKDSTAGGSGSHRWGIYSTYEPSNNPVVQAYNVRRGIFYYPNPSSPTGSQWVYGGNNKRALSAYRLPASSWIAAINACDTTVTNADSSTEPQFRAGLIVTGDMQPLTVMQDLMGACNGRLAEVGGIYEVLAGAPGSAVYAFTDADIVISDGQSFAPFPGLQDTYNAVEATFPDPTMRWVSNNAPGRYNDGTGGTPDWEDEDGGRQLVASATFDAVPYANQVQRLMQTIANDNRQFRTHTFTLPPDAYGIVKPNRIVSWTSARNGYTNKLFIVISVSGKQGWNQAVAIKELDPADYDFDPATQQLPAPVGSLAFETSPPQPMSGWDAFASTVQDNTGTDRRPAITVGCTGHMQDVQAVRVQVRLAITKQLVFDSDGNSPYDPTEDSPAWQLSGGWCLPGTDFEVRGILVPFSGRVTYWSNETVSGGVVTEGAWLGVTTDAVLLGNADIGGLDATAFSDALAAELATLTTWIGTGDLPTEIAANTTAINANASAISTEASNRASAVADEASSRLATDASQALDVRDLYKTILDQGTQLGDVIIGQKLAQQSVLQSLAVTAAGQKAQWTSDIQVAVGPTSAIAQSVTDLSASTAVLNTTLNANIQTVQTVLTNAINTQAAATNSLLLQVTGGYAGSDPTLLTSGLVYTEQQARISGDNSLSTAISLLAAGTGLQFDWKVGYTFDADIQSWGGNGTPTWATGGYLRPANQVSGPYVVSPTGLGVAAATYAQVEARLKRVGSPTWSGLAWYKRTTDSTWDSGRQSTQTEPIWDVNGFAVVTWGMTWDSTIDQIRLDLSTAQTGTDYFDIDWVYIGRPSPSASQAQVGDVQTALTSSILAEASDRQALSTLVTGAADPTGLTLSTVSSGMIYDEKTARTTADSSLNTLITGVQSEIDAANTNISGISSAQSTLSTAVTTLSGTVSTNTTAITALQTSVNDPTTGLSAINTVVDTLSSEITGGGGSAAAQQNAQAVRTLQLIANDLAVQLADGILSAKGQQLSLAGTIASVTQQLTGQISQVSGNVDLVNSAVTQIQQTLPGLASLGITQSLQAQTTLNSAGITTLGAAISSINSTITNLATSAALNALTSTVAANTNGVSTLNSEVASLTSTVNNPTTGVTALNTAVSTLSGSVTSQGAAITSANAAITALQSTVNNGTTGVAATASALSSLSTTVSGQGSTLTAQATSVQSLNAALGGSTSLINVKMELLTGPTGYERYGIVAAQSDGVYRSASLFVDTPNDHTQPTRVGFAADQTVFFASDGTPIVAINGDGEMISANSAFYANLLTGAFRLQAA